MIIHSAHDTQLMVILKWLNPQNFSLVEIPYSSVLHFDFFKNKDNAYFLKISFNDKPLVFEGVSCSADGMCPFDKMNDYLTKISYKSQGFDLDIVKQSCWQKVYHKSKEVTLLDLTDLERS